MKTNGNAPGSFRDPSGFLFYNCGSIYRQVNNIYKENYDHFMNSGLCDTLVDNDLLISHKEVDFATFVPNIINDSKKNTAYKIIKPELIQFISYPYEWCFRQLKDSALCTIAIQKKSLEFGMTLKDSSAFNIQFHNGKPILIDTLSFERYSEGQPWLAYRQFCQHFLAPLALMSYKDIRLKQLFRIHMDGIPLDLASSLLQPRTYFRCSLLFHIHLHAKSQKYYAHNKKKATSIKKNHKISRMAFLGIIDSLESAIKRLKCPESKTEWSEYYEHTNNLSESFLHKKQIVSEYLDVINPVNAWDIGANIGLFSRLASEKGIQTISFDIDHAAVEKNYIECVKNGESNLLPLLLDLNNPSPGLGWGNEERMSLIKRGPADTLIALAFIHHLAISNNLPFENIADYFSRICKSLIIEFVPKSDPQAQRLLLFRKDIFSEYTKQNFEYVFSKYFTLLKCKPIMNSERIMYLMLRK